MRGAPVHANGPSGVNVDGAASCFWEGASSARPPPPPPLPPPASAASASAASRHAVQVMSLKPLFFPALSCFFPKPDLGTLASQATQLYEAASGAGSAIRDVARRSGGGKDVSGVMHGQHDSCARRLACALMRDV